METAYILQLFLSRSEQTYKLGENIWWRSYDWLVDYSKDEYRRKI